MRSTPFSINIDESTVKSSKKRILNVLVCLYDESLQKSDCNVYRAIEMTVVNVDTVHDAIIESFEEDNIHLQNLISILSDSAAYMRGRNNGFE